jgi:hypothetical protein
MERFVFHLFPERDPDAHGAVLAFGWKRYGRRGLHEPRDLVDANADGGRLFGLRFYRELRPLERLVFDLLVLGGPDQVGDLPAVRRNDGPRQRVHQSWGCSLADE